MEFTLCFIFDEKQKKVIMVKKDRSQFAGTLNGLGGKIESGESPRDAVLRELKEEANITENKLVDIKNVVTVVFPKDVKLHVFCGILWDTEEFEQCESEEIDWYGVKGILDNSIPDINVAGYGEVQYFIRMSRILMRDWIYHEDERW